MFSTNISDSNGNSKPVSNDSALLSSENTILMED